MPTATVDSTTQNKALIKSYFEALSGRRKTDEIIDRFVADPALKQHILDAEVAFPAYKLVIEEMIAEGDTVAVRATFSGTHSGPLGGMPATGKPASAPVMLFYHVESDKIVAHSMVWDVASVMQQLQS